MKQETEFTLRRFWDANHVHGAVNATGVANSIGRHGSEMLKAGWGTDQINEDPVIRYLAMGLARLCGARIDYEQLIEVKSAIGGLRGELEAKGYKFD